MATVQQAAEIAPPPWENSQGQPKSDPLGLGNVASSTGAIFTSLTDLASKISTPAFWLRVGEFVVGCAMMLIGLGRLTGTGNDLRAITRTARNSLTGGTR